MDKLPVNQEWYIRTVILSSWRLKQEDWSFSPVEDLRLFSIAEVHPDDSPCRVWVPFYLVRGSSAYLHEDAVPTWSQRHVIVSGIIWNHQLPEFREISLVSDSLRVPCFQVLLFCWHSRQCFHFANEHAHTHSSEWIANAVSCELLRRTLTLLCIELWIWRHLLKMPGWLAFQNRAILVTEKNLEQMLFSLLWHGY